MTCPTCKGHTEIDCPSCHGRNPHCPCCAGGGRIRCPVCNGTGDVPRRMARAQRRWGRA